MKGRKAQIDSLEEIPEENSSENLEEKENKDKDSASDFMHPERRKRMEKKSIQIKQTDQQQQQYQQQQHHYSHSRDKSQYDVQRRIQDKEKARVFYKKRKDNERKRQREKWTQRSMKHGYERKLDDGNLRSEEPKTIKKALSNATEIQENRVKSAKKSKPKPNTFKEKRKESTKFKL